MLADVKRLFRHTAVYLVGNVLNRAGAFLLLPLYTHKLSTADYGRLDLLYMLTAIVSVVWSAGLAHTTLRFYFDESSQAASNRVVVSNLLLSALLTTAGSLLILPFADRLSLLLLDDRSFANAIYICLIILVLESMTEVAYAYIRAREWSGLYVALSLLKLAIQVSGSIYFVAIKDAGVLGVLYANLASVGVIWIVVAAIVLRNCGVAIAPERIGEMLRYGVPFAIGGILATISGATDRIVLKEAATLDDVGVYALACRFAMVLALVVTEPFTRSYGPFRFSIMGQPHAAELQAGAAEQVLLAAIAVGLGIAMFSPEALQIAIGPSYQLASWYIPPLLLLTSLGGVFYCFETGILYYKRTDLLLAIRSCEFAVRIGLSILLIPYFGVWGLLISLSCTAVLSGALTNLASQRLYPITYPFNRMLVAVAGGAAAWGVSLLANRYSIWVSIPLKLAIYLIFIGSCIAANPKLREVSISTLSKMREFLHWIRPGRLPVNRR